MRGDGPVLGHPPGGTTTCPIQEDGKWCDADPSGFLSCTGIVVAFTCWRHGVDIAYAPGSRYTWRTIDLPNQQKERHPMRSPIESHHQTADGKPAGGTTTARGVKVDWQNGPLAVEGQRVEPNGAFVEDVIAIALDRLEYYNSTEFRCRENSLAITKLEEALHWLDHRTRDREARGVEGTHAV